MFDKAKLTPQRLGVSSSEIRTAGKACQHLLPTGGGQTRAYVQQLIARELRVCRCMRAHGVTNFPDPGSDGHFPDPGSDGHFPDIPLHRVVAENSPQYQGAQKGCWRLGAP